MSAHREILADTRGLLFVFDVDMAEPALRALAGFSDAKGPEENRPDRPLAAAALALIPGAAPDLRHVELFHTRDLAGLGLPGYLAAAYDIDPGQIAEHDSALRQSDGFILLLLSDGLALPATLALHDKLRLLCTLQTPRAAISMVRLASDTGRGGLGTPAAAPAPPRQLRSARYLLAILVLLVLLAGLWLTLTL